MSAFMIGPTESGVVYAKLGASRHGFSARQIIYFRLCCNFNPHRARTPTSCYPVLPLVVFHSLASVA